MVALLLDVQRVVLLLAEKSLQIFLGETTLVRGDLFIYVFVEPASTFVNAFVDQLRY